MITLGRRLLGAGAIALGLEGLWWGDFASPWQPVPHTLAGYEPLAYATALALLVAGIGMLLWRADQPPALLFAALFTVFSMLWTVRIVHAPTVVAMWSGCAEDVVLVLGALVAANVAREAPIRVRGVRLGFGLCLLSFAAAHVVYSRETAAMVPAWMPPNALTWAYATGGAHAIAGLALLADIFALAAVWAVTAMFVTFELLVWLPTLATAPTAAISWRGNAVNLCLVASAMLVAELIASARTPPISFLSQTADQEESV